MKTTIGIGSRLVLTLVCTATQALATDYYVDAGNGSDKNSGTTPLDAWRTLTHAVATVNATLPSPSRDAMHANRGTSPMGAGLTRAMAAASATVPSQSTGVAHRIFIAPGTYNPALGEVYPLQLRPGIRLIGTQGNKATVLEGPASRLLSFQPQVSDRYTEYFGKTSGAEGLTLRNATEGIVLDHSPSFSQLVVENMLSVGIMVEAGAVLPVIDRPSFDRVTIQNCGIGLHISASGEANPWPTMSECTIRNSVSNGIQIHQGSARLSLLRSRIVDNGGTGVSGGAARFETFSALVTVMASDSLFAGNGGSGVRLSSSGGVVDMQATHCTFANNAVNGLEAFHPERLVGAGSSITLCNSVLCGNGDDLAVSPATVLRAQGSNSADGDLLGMTSCLAADAQFVDPASGDYRLRFGSPCIDTGDVPFPDKSDLVGRGHDVDGNLDTLIAPDIGAFEFEPLFSRGVRPEDSVLVLEIWGPTERYRRSTLFASDSWLLDMPEWTKYGFLYLQRGTEVQFASVPTRSGIPTIVEIKIPTSESLRTNVLSLQALIWSSAAPLGAAYSNPLEIPLPE